MGESRKGNGRASLATIINGRFNELEKRIDKASEESSGTRSMVVALASEVRADHLLRDERQKQMDERWKEVSEGIKTIKERNSQVDIFLTMFRKIIVYGAVVLGGLATIFGVVLGAIKFIIPLCKG